MWFKKLTGFEEKNPDFVRHNIEIQGDTFKSKVTQETFCFGRLEIPTLEDLRHQNTLKSSKNNSIIVQEIVADVQELHCDKANRNAVFQAASQFNLLEMVNPTITPEHGIDGYELDNTQGPACAIVCGAGTIYRNYFVEVNKQLGQSTTQQVDCLDLIGEALNNKDLQLWNMKNGYALINQHGIGAINNALSKLNNTEREILKGKLKVGIQWDTEVTLSEDKHKVTQVYCSALPVAYSEVESIYFENFARLILEATYEATLYAACINMKKNGSNLVYLTLVGGGVFGNENTWIFESLEKAICKFKDMPLDIRIVSYGRTNPALTTFINSVNGNIYNI